MPEGDTIHYAASRIRALLERRVPEEILTPQPTPQRKPDPERRRKDGCNHPDDHA
jgi:endonuclease-8